MSAIDGCPDGRVRPGQLTATRCPRVGAVNDGGGAGSTAVEVTKVNIYDADDDKLMKSHRVYRDDVTQADEFYQQLLSDGTSRFLPVELVASCSGTTCITEPGVTQAVYDGSPTFAVDPDEGSLTSTQEGQIRAYYADQLG
jgi:hypothetical protein